MAQKRIRRRVAAEAESTGILILGMHRSGTSATAGALRILGVPLGERMVPAAADNPSGYWEHAQIVAIHERLLGALRRTWEDVRPLPADWLDSDPAKRAEAELAELIGHDFSGAPLWAAKDPRMIRFLPMWCRLLDRLGIRATFLFVARDPEEVAASLAARDGIAAGHARLLWLQHLIEAERATRQRPRAMIEYGRLLAEPERALQDAGAALGIDWPKSPSACREELAAFLDTGQRHHDSGSTHDRGGMLAPEARTAYAVCARISRGNPDWAQIAKQQPVVGTAVAAADWVAGLAEALARCREGSAVQDARLAMTDRALDEATTLSLSRLAQLHSLESRVQQTDRALDEVTELSLARLAQVRALEARVQQTDDALQEATALSLTRLEQVQALEARLHDTDRALDDATALAVARLAQVQALEARIQDTDRTLELAKRLAQERLEAIDRLRARIEETEAETLMERERGDVAERQLADVLASRSWRYTRPIRSFARAVKLLWSRSPAQ